MLKTKNPGYKAIVVISLILLIAGLVITGFVAVKCGNLADQVVCLLAFATLIYAAYYILSGYGKDAARYYKIFTFVLAAVLLVALAAVGKNTDRYLVSLLLTLQLVLVLVLGLSKDLGKKNSMYLCYAYLLICVIEFAMSFSGALIDIGFSAVELIFAIVMTVMTVAKYIDKAARGTK